MMSRKLCLVALLALFSVPHNLFAWCDGFSSAPGRGFAGYGGKRFGGGGFARNNFSGYRSFPNFGYGFARQNYHALQRQRFARNRRKFNSNGAQLRAAQVAQKSGNIQLASMLYRRVAVSRPKNQLTRFALSNIVQLQSDGVRKLRTIEGDLQSIQVADDGNWQKEVRDQFAKFEKLYRSYRRVPRVNTRILATVGRQRKLPLFAEALNEPAAIELLARGQKLEAKGDRCCALLAYKKAAKLTPAPSAVAASQKVHRLQLDESLVAEAKICRELQWCHKTYKQAAVLANVSPKRATTLYTKIIDRAPRLSRIHLEARRQIVKLAAN